MPSFALSFALASALAEPQDMSEAQRRAAIADHPARYAILHPAPDGIHPDDTPVVTFKEKGPEWNSTNWNSSNW